MALLITVDNKAIFVPGETAALLWLIYTGERKGTAKTRAHVKKIRKWYLNRATAPQSYRDANPLPLLKKRRQQLASQPRLPYSD